jgi:hypothetical protein
MEQAALAAESHRQCFYWIDEWCDLTVEDVMQLELATDVKLNQVCINPYLLQTKMFLT